MVDVSTISAISAVVAAVGVIVGVVFAVLELRNATRQRRTELLVNIYSNWATKEWAGALEKVRTRESKDFQEYAKEYGLTEFYQVLAVFEGLGHMHRNLIDKDLVCELISESTKMAWEKVKPMVQGARKRIAQRKSGEYVPVYKWWEYVYNEVRKREQGLQQIQQ
ncbi:MAG: hypothetical protein PVF15_02320 [Candidatus Bathyarchaeota archaeon]|jgi:hypothetical protein